MYTRARILHSEGQGDHSMESFLASVNVRHMHRLWAVGGALVGRPAVEVLLERVQSITNVSVFAQESAIGTALPTWSSIQDPSV